MTKTNRVTLEFRTPVISRAAALVRYVRDTGEIRADFGQGVCNCAVELIEGWDHDEKGKPTDTERITLEFDTERLAADLRNTIKQAGYIKADFGLGPTICRVAVIEEGAHENDRGDARPRPRQRPAGAAGQAGSGASADAMVAEVNSPGVGCDVEMWLKEGSPRRLNGRIAAIDELGGVVLDNLLGYLPGTKMWIPRDNIACVAWGGKEEAEDGAEENGNSGLHHSGEADNP